MNMMENRQQPTENDLRWEAIVHRRASGKRLFYYGVRTTGVYCRPTCAARRPLRENVDFFDTRQEAEAAGFRPCKRCRPEQQPLTERHAAKVAAACRAIEKAIEEAEEPPQLEALARQADLSPYHFHRIFKSVTGITPKAYAAAHRTKRVRSALSRARSVTDAIYDSGYSSNGRFYENTDHVLGMTPRAFRAGGHRQQIRFAIGECSLGSILVAQSDRGVCAITLGDDPEALARDLQDQFPNADLVGGDAGFEELIAKVVGLVEAPETGCDLPLDVRGTAFQQRVWQALRAIPAGTTASYSEIAKRIGAPKAVRAVASACASNKLAVAIPCHRVVRNDGGLSGYRWGVERKRELLKRENAA